MLISEDQIRCNRQILHPAIGPEGQTRLGRSRVAIVGCGGLGSVLSHMMVRMGVGRVTVIDGDTPDITNLHRQILFDEVDVAAGLPKAQSACEKLRRINSRVEVVGIAERLDACNVERLLADHEVIELIVFDLWEGSHQRVRLHRNPECVCCGQRRFFLLNR